jgi:hypothetical protein
VSLPKGFAPSKRRASFNGGSSRGTAIDADLANSMARAIYQKRNAAGGTSPDGGKVSYSILRFVMRLAPPPPHRQAPMYIKACVLLTQPRRGWYEGSTMPHWESHLTQTLPDDVAPLRGWMQYRTAQ